jgi:dienelactone hydrolase
MIMSYRRILLLVMSVLALSQDAAADTPRKGPDELPSVKELPNPFTFNDGSKVLSPADWERRREELKELVLTYQYGHLPPAAPVSALEQRWEAGEGARKREAKSEETRGPLADGATETHLLLKTGPDGKVSIPLVLTRPAGGGPFPVIIRGDLCWGRVSSKIAAEVVRRGYMLAEFDRTAVVPDENVGRDVALYGLYPEHDFAALAGWAWGFHRVADYLLTRDDVQKDHLAVTGHSRGGKAALLAGATDERIALTAPNNSGCGGAGCYRLSAPKSETIDVITKRFPYWFQAQFGEFAGKVDRLPIDQHSVKALVAPRALLSTEALGDLWANPSGTQHTFVAAREVYGFLGAPHKIGIAFREGGHEHNLDDWKVLLDFADRQWFGKATSRTFDKLAFPDNPKPFPWAAPKAQAR